MTVLLERAFKEASRLPEAIQEQLARQLLKDIEGEEAWDQTLANSQDALEELAAKAVDAKRQGNTVNKGFDEL